MGRKRIYATAAEANEARLQRAKAWHESFSAVRMPWRVLVDAMVVAVFATERDARGFAKARYGDEATVERRRERGPYGTEDHICDQCADAVMANRAVQHG
jgi:hypothetical protein